MYGVLSVVKVLLENEANKEEVDKVEKVY